ncbi:MAG: GNAT family N-acetyltransferase [Phoenicibacter congonensis]|uniref:GNAT family N-acetyltransferase n=1 Tax=Phoenicibacter congonensis TaxID=1944646 RepID=A0AA43RIP2_9ACTN|nr:GNAT family N-acetyltransferase [Phoenicibacter congonensis]
MSEPLIRLATVDDSDAILAIYEPYISTSITFEETVPRADAFRERVATILKKYPYLVAEIDGEVVGYAYAGAFRERQAYQWNAELSVYLTPKAQGFGLGKRLYACIIELVKLQGVKVLYGIVTCPNEASRKLHERFDFELSLLQKNAGYSCGEWRDVKWYVRYLTDEFEDNPKPPIPFPKFLEENTSLVEEIIANA